MSKAQIKRLGVAIRNGSEFEPGLYTDYILWLNQVLQVAIDEVAEALEWDGGPCYLSGEGLPEINRVNLFMTGRVKMLETIREKLRRMPDFPLTSIQDLVGVRIEGSLSLSQQQTVAQIIADHFRRLGAPKAEIRSILEQPHQGYRAVHVHANFPAARIEVQIRTELQSAWANTYEVASDLFGRHIRYGEATAPYSETVTALHDISGAAYVIEQQLSKVNDTAAEVFFLLQGKYPRLNKQQMNRHFHDILNSRIDILYQVSRVRRSLEDLELGFAEDLGRKLSDTEDSKEV